MVGWLPVTAKDYVFAFQRMFRTDSLSPHAGKFASIEGASARMEGTAQPLGVSASGDYTLVSRLTEADPLFLRGWPTRPPSPVRRFLHRKARPVRPLHPDAPL